MADTRPNVLPVARGATLVGVVLTTGLGFLTLAGGPHWSGSLPLCGLSLLAAAWTAGAGAVWAAETRKRAAASIRVSRPETPDPAVGPPPTPPSE
jgi:hypothetical protein